MKKFLGNKILLLFSHGIFVLIIIGCGNVSTKLHHLNNVGNVNSVEGNLKTMQEIHRSTFSSWPEDRKSTWDQLWSTGSFNQYKDYNYRNYVMPSL